MSALARFWWLVVAGLAAGAFAALVVLNSESAAKHTATATIFVNSRSAPYLRTQETQVQSQGSKLMPVRNGKGTKLRPVQQPSTSTTQAPDTSTLVTAANLYPLLIESDQVKQIREALIGKVPGTVKADALNSSTNTFGVFKPGSLPIVEITATSQLAGHAEELADGTVRAFSRWIAAKQKAAGIPVAQRISVQQLQQPKVTTVGGPSAGLPLFVGGLVVLAFCGLAFMADHAWPAAERRERTREAPATAASPKLDG
ncbi:MAG TPA: hypothetical protein VH297_09510 [Gaiellaceae bacterium]